MDRDAYRRLRLNPRLRGAFESVVSQQPPTRSELADALADAGMPDAMIDEHIDKLAKLARQVAMGAKRFHAIQEAHLLALKALDRIEAEDSLIGELPDPDDEDTGEISAAEALRRQRSGVVGDPSLKQSEPANVSWRQR